MAYTDLRNSTRSGGSQMEWQASQSREMTRLSARQCPGQTCGGLTSLFFEPEGSVTRDYWVYVGEGKGGFNKDETFNFVGRGAGSFEVEEVKNYRPCARWLCIGCSALVLLGACIELVSRTNPESS